MLIDSHCHIQSSEFDADREAVIERCRQRGMRCIVVGNNHEDSAAAVQLAERHDVLFAVVGLHPIFLPEEEWSAAAYDELLQHPKVVGIGEIGLDYYRIWADSADEEDAAKQEQSRVFAEQLRYAKATGKPVVIHCRDAYPQALEILQDFRGLPAVMHTFLGDAQTAERFLAHGAFLSFSGIATFGDDGEIRHTIQSVPLSRMMIETDAPYLTPAPLRGRRNEPIYVEHTARAIAKLKGIPVEEVITATGANATRFFRLPA